MIPLPPAEIPALFQTASTTGESPREFLKAAHCTNFDGTTHEVATPPVDPNIAPANVARVTGQNLQVLNMLRAGKRITQADVYPLGITRLAARAHDLRSFGYPVGSCVELGMTTATYWLREKA